VILPGFLVSKADFTRSSGWYKPILWFI